MNSLTINRKRLFIDILFDILGGVFIAAGAYNFAAAMNFPLVGFTGIALILHNLFGLPIGIMNVVLNIPVAVLCYKILGRMYFFNSIKSLLITSVIIDFVAPHIPVYRGDAIMAAVCTGVLSGIGYALIYMRRSSTGGSDFIILAIKAKKPYMTIGRLSFAIDTIVVVLGTIFVAKSVDGLIYGIMISYIISMVIDKTMYGMSSGKMTLIVTSRAKEIAECIDETTDRGATFLKAQGSYSSEEKDVVMCACSNKQMYMIKDEVRGVDPDAFMIVVESSEIMGEGFRKPLV